MTDRLAVCQCFHTHGFHVPLGNGDRCMTDGCRCRWFRDTGNVLCPGCGGWVHASVARDGKCGRCAA